MKKILFKGLLVVSSLVGMTLTTNAEETTDTATSTTKPSIQLANRPGINLFPSLNNTLPATTSTTSEATDDNSSIEQTTNTQQYMPKQPATNTTTGTKTGAAVHVTLNHESLGEFGYTMSFYGEPYSTLIIPIDASMGKITSVSGGNFIINQDGGLTGTYPSPDEAKNVSIDITPVGKTPVQVTLNFLDEDYEPIPDVPYITYYGKADEQTNIALLDIDGYTFKEAESFSFARNNSSAILLYTFGETNEILNLIYVSNQVDDIDEEEYEGSSTDNLQQTDTSEHATDSTITSIDETFSNQASSDNATNESFTKDFAKAALASTSSNSPTTRTSQATESKITLTSSNEATTTQANELPKTSSVNPVFLGLLGLLLVTISGIPLKNVVKKRTS
ncbi:hypothetical protein [Vagococcus zengguangii]|uniref:Uncharacterized protein n=1 Tax=Vagococcus zengguangii TaxID=2571750 RepID=A0A4D7D0A8_9ENTE|nr:hypothetical protein [Vagococcus zengguangii]QCI87166.1 hypothetical protein FA707_09585 [Vagococcus zengguangii]TLG80671.1 hypothetical protein FE258_04200 [Vagococcus zengguangii]